MRHQNQRPPGGGENLKLHGEKENPSHPAPQLSPAPSQLQMRTLKSSQRAIQMSPAQNVGS